mgnify:CR=1 FL=1
MKEEEGLYFIHPSEPKSPKKFGDMSPEHQEYVINSVKLISNLCQGGNKPVIEELKKLKFVDFAICFNMVSKDIAAAMRAESNAVPSGSIKNASRLRKQFVSLLSSAFVDVDSPRILEETLVRTPSWSLSCRANRPLRSSSAHTTTMPRSGLRTVRV